MEEEFVAFDLETTGLSPTLHRIVEFGAVRFRADGVELDRMVSLVNPLCSIPPDATKVHGITDEMVQGQPSINDILPNVMEFLIGSNTVLLAHNASFDVGFLSAVFDASQVNGVITPVLDTLVIARWRFPRLRDHRLVTIARHLGVAVIAEHRSLGDALVLKSVFLKMLLCEPSINCLDDVFHIAPPLFFDSNKSGQLSVPDRYFPLVQAMQVGKRVLIVYDGGTKGRKERQVTPRMMSEQRGYLYLTAFCHIDGIEKQFRLDRILEIHESARRL